MPLRLLCPKLPEDQPRALPSGRPGGFYLASPSWQVEVAASPKRGARPRGRLPPAGRPDRRTTTTSKQQHEKGEVTQGTEPPMGTGDGDDPRSRSPFFVHATASGTGSLSVQSSQPEPRVTGGHRVHMAMRRACKGTNLWQAR